VLISNANSKVELMTDIEVYRNCWH